MNQNNTPHKKKEFIPKRFKFVIAAASMASTLGLWGIFSQADLQNNGNQVVDIPLPTVATLVSVNIIPTANTGNTSVSANSSLNTLPVVTQPPATTVNSAPVLTYNQPAPITSTRSSHP